MNEGLKRLKEEFNENPVAVIGVISVALAAAGKVINRRVKKSKRYPSYAG